MKMFTTSKGNSFGSNILVHLGDSPDISANRIEGMFAHKNPSALRTNDEVFVMDVYGRPTKKITLQEHVDAFCAFAADISIVELQLSAYRPLTLLDAWEDDPIGSAGVELIDRRSTSAADLLAMEALFRPFTGIMQPWSINATLSDSDVVALHKRYRNNQYFKSALKSRKRRAQAIGEDWGRAKKQEIVWQHYTFLLREWALKQGYDAFHYLNDKEGKESHSYVTFTPNQAIPTGRQWNFAPVRFKELAPSLIREAFERKAKQHSNTGVSVTSHAMWADQDPMVFFDAVTG